MIQPLVRFSRLLSIVGSSKDAVDILCNDVLANTSITCHALSMHKEVYVAHGVNWSITRPWCSSVNSVEVGFVELRVMMISQALTWDALVLHRKLQNYLIFGHTNSLVETRLGLIGP